MENRKSRFCYDNTTFTLSLKFCNVHIQMQKKDNVLEKIIKNKNFILQLKKTNQCNIYLI